MTIRTWTLALCVLLAAGRFAGAGEAPQRASSPRRASFTAKPKAVRKGKGVTISFAASVPTDVEVAILDAKGAIVRHLAAGMLGEKAPKPLGPGLSQTLTWDGKDDRGKPAKAASIRVSLGMKPKFGRILAWKGEAVGNVGGLAVDEKGLAYILTREEGKRPASVHVFTRDGKYIKTILPYPANLPFEKVKSLGHIEISEGQRVPIVRDPRYFTCYPDLHGYGLAAHTMCLVGEQLVMSNPWAMYSMYHVKLSNRRLLIIDKDGGVPSNYLGPFMVDSIRPGAVQLAPVLGEKAVYATGLVHKRDWKKKAKPFHVVWKVKLDEKGPPKPFLGEMNKPGNDEKHLNDPRGVAVDRFGNLYVSDNGNNRIAVYKPDGSLLGRIKIERPGPLAIHQKKNNVYVMKVAEHHYPYKGQTLQKLSPAVDSEGKWIGDSSKVVAATKEITRAYAGYYAMTVDGTAEPTVIWLVANTRKASGLCRIEEGADGKLGELQPVLRGKTPLAGFTSALAVDRAREEVYTNHDCSHAGNSKSHVPLLRINGRTGEMTRLKVHGSDIDVGADGHLYVLSRKGRYGPSAQLMRLKRDGTPAPFSGTGSHVLVNKPSTLHGARGHCVDAAGNVYHMYPGSESKNPRVVVDVYGPDGKIKQKRRIVSTHHSTSIRVDYSGNLYFADNIKSASAVYPPELEGKVPKALRLKNGKINWYAWYGGVLKFPPSGGEVGGEKGEAYTSQCGGKLHVKVEGALWVRTGVYPVPGGARWLGCSCIRARFDVDGFGRVFMPDAATCSVRVFDTNGNPIKRFGSYGNMDSQGPGSKIPVPEIPLAWPMYVAASDEAVYVSDVINRRIVKAKLSYAAQESCPAP